MVNWNILDCTLRDGGYYTNWDFSDDLVASYLKAMASMPISFIELGYRDIPGQGYLGAYRYLPRNVIEKARSVIPHGPDFAVMIDAKNVNVADLQYLLTDCRDLVKMVRMAIDPSKIDHGIALSRRLKEMGYKVGINLMYLSQDYDKEKTLITIASNEEFVDFVSFVDSFGACYPEDVEKTVELAKSILNVPIGFHGHDNISLAFANSLAAIKAGGTVVDSTILGMGRGAGNLRTELISSYFSHLNNEVIDLFPAAEALDLFDQMKSEFRWGAELPYIVAGLNSLPQAEVMEWVGRNRYSTPAIVNKLRGQTGRSVADGSHRTTAKSLSSMPIETHTPFIILGGGSSVERHVDSLIKFAKAVGAVIIHVSSRHLSLFEEKDCDQIVCLVGDEHEKIDELQFENLGEKTIGFVVDAECYFGLPDISSVSGKTYCTSSIIPEGSEADDILGLANPIGLALAVVRDIKSTVVYLAGFDGYDEHKPKDMWLMEETQATLDVMEEKYPNISITSITQTAYNVEKKSLYSLLFASGNDKL